MADDHNAIDMEPRGSSRDPISICGWLHKMKRKQRAFLPAWVHRWFTVENSRICWYFTKEDMAPRGSIPLRSVTSVKVFEGSGGGSSKEGVFSFIVRSEERNLLLRAVNERDLQRWVNQLKMHIDYYKNSNNVTATSSGTSKKDDGYDAVLSKIEAALMELECLEKQAHAEPNRNNPKSGNDAKVGRDDKGSGGEDDDDDDDYSSSSSGNDGRRQQAESKGDSSSNTTINTVTASPAKSNIDKEAYNISRQEVAGAWGDADVKDSSTSGVSSSSNRSGSVSSVASAKIIRVGSNSSIPLPTSGKPRPQPPKHRRPLSNGQRGSSGKGFEGLET